MRLSDRSECLKNTGQAARVIIFGAGLTGFAKSADQIIGLASVRPGTGVVGPVPLHIESIERTHWGLYLCRGLWTRPSSPVQSIW